MSRDAWEQAEAVDLVARVGGLVREVALDVVLRTCPCLASTITQLLRAQPELPILELTMHDDDVHVFAALRAGARGYLVKVSDGSKIVRAVYSAADGEAVTEVS